MYFVSRTFGFLLAVFCLSGCVGQPQEVSYGPWDAFTYTREGSSVVGRAEGEYETLNKCMNWVTMRTKRTGGSYYCGFDCETKAGGVIRCEKLMGYPI